MKISYKLMDYSHVDEIYEISAKAFHTPWSLDSIHSELNNTLAKYVVAIDEENNSVVGFAGMWIIAGEGNITNIAVSDSYKHKGIGYNLILGLIELCKENNCSDLTLEVRVSNKIAQSLYEKVGFINEGIRKKYYEDNGEDAIIMWKRNII